MAKEPDPNARRQGPNAREHTPMQERLTQPLILAPSDIPRDAHPLARIAAGSQTSRTTIVLDAKEETKLGESTLPSSSSSPGKLQVA
jgi:hypothetical protein